MQPTQRPGCCHTHTAGGSSCCCCNTWSFPFNALCPYQLYPVSKLQHRALAPGMGEAYISHASEPVLALLCVLSRYYTKRQREPETWFFWRPAEWLVGYVLPYSERLHSVKVLDGNRWVNPAPVEAVLTLWRHGVKYVYVYTGNISKQCIHTPTHTYKYLVDILTLQWLKDLTESFICFISFECVCACMLYTYTHTQVKAHLLWQMTL